jgi:hypothetical protein
LLACKKAGDFSRHAVMVYFDDEVGKKSRQDDGVPFAPGALREVDG